MDNQYKEYENELEEVNFLIASNKAEIKKSKITAGICTVFAAVSAAIAISGFVLGDYYNGAMGTALTGINTLGAATSFVNIKKQKQLLELNKNLKSKIMDELCVCEIKNFIANNISDEQIFPDVYGEEQTM